MSAMNTMMTQHAELQDLSGNVSAALDAGAPGGDAAAVHDEVLRLTGKLAVHLAAEDGHVYPVLRRHPDARVRDVAEQFTRELGGLSSALEDYKAEWHAVRGLARLPAPFVRQTRLLLAALELRIRREEEELYPLLFPG